MHASKLGLTDWARAAHAPHSSPKAIAGLLGVSAPTARRMSRILNRLEPPPGADRFAALVKACPPDTDEHTDAWAVPDLPVTMHLSDNPVAGMSGGEKAAMNALRHRPLGATVEMVARLAGLTARHTRRCLGALQGRGLAKVNGTRIVWGYGSRRVRLWSLTWSDECARALGYLPRRPVAATEADDAPERVPPSYWHLFWSGTSASELTVHEHGLLIAETLVSSTNPHARAWAMSHIPADVLRECRSLRGCDRGAAAAGLDFTIRERADA